MSLYNPSEGLQKVAQEQCRDGIKNEYSRRILSTLSNSGDKLQVGQLFLVWTAER